MTARNYVCKLFRLSNTLASEVTCPTGTFVDRTETYAKCTGKYIASDFAIHLNSMYRCGPLRFSPYLYDRHEFSGHSLPSWLFLNRYWCR